MITWIFLPETGKRSMFADESESLKAQELKLDGSTTRSRPEVFARMVLARLFRRDGTMPLGVRGRFVPPPTTKDPGT
ncbi:hypothetical protein ACFQX6_48810 [Streptosporangium lutulentum]